MNTSRRKQLSERNSHIIERLDTIYNHKDELNHLPLNKHDKYVIMSDLHLGDGKGADNFERNEETLLTALNYYKAQGYHIILLGDVEELWQFDLHEIVQRYKNSIYHILSDFKPGKVFRVFGNHDSEWGGLEDPVAPVSYHLYGAPEALLIDSDIILLHGHQGDSLAEKRAWISRFWVRLFRIIEPFVRKLGYENYAATESQIPKDREKILYQWAKSKKIILICGHTHRAMFASRCYYRWLVRQIILIKELLHGEELDEATRRELKILLKHYRKEKRSEKKKGRDIDELDVDQSPLPCYFNTGSGLFKTGITLIELEHQKIHLVKWNSDSSLSISERRVEFWDDCDLQAFRDEIMGLPVDGSIRYVPKIE
ncbi:metallophosphoesterase family protein [candidate division KSB1 bacterium]|nr:metallophosphoesterase family protein [candidate division KSB1 bacterium]